MLDHDGLPVLEEVLVEGGVLSVVSLQHCCVETCYFFSGWWEVDCLP